MADVTKDVIMISLDHFNNLKSTFKPSKDEWTSFASILSRNIDTNSDGQLKLITLATGTKSVSGNKAKLSNLIIDGHAESLCRRSFKYYLANRLKQTTESNCNLLNELKNTEFHMLISQLPCGTVRRYKGSDNSIRKKPGRGELCSKATCFDKILKWSILGLQGHKLSSIIVNPIRLKSIIIGNCCTELNDQDKDAFKQGFDIEINPDLKKSMKMFFESEDNPSDNSITNSNYYKNAVSDEDDKLVKEPERKKLKVNTLESNIETISSNQNSIYSRFKPEIHFSDLLDKEDFIRRDHKRAQDKSIVHYLDPVSQTYRTDVICEGRKHGTTMKTYSKVQLTLSPNSLNALIQQQMDNYKVDLNQNEFIKRYDLLWNQLKSHSNFERWTD